MVATPSLFITLNFHFSLSDRRPIMIQVATKIIVFDQVQTLGQKLKLIVKEQLFLFTSVIVQSSRFVYDMTHVVSTTRQLMSLATISSSINFSLVIEFFDYDSTHLAYTLDNSLTCNNLSLHWKSSS